MSASPKARESAVEAALSAVSRRARSARELGEVLVRKGYSQDEVREAVARLAEWRYVDDGDLADQLSARGRRQVLGKRRVAQDLARRRVDPASAAQALEKHYGEGEDELMEQALEAALRVLGGVRTGKDAARLARRLISRGFLPERVFDRLRALSPEEGETD